MSYINNGVRILQVSYMVVLILIATLESQSLRLRMNDGRYLEGTYRGITWTRNGRMFGHGCVLHLQFLDDDDWCSVEVEQIVNIEGGRQPA